jgi:hypothetical protein
MNQEKQPEAVPQVHVQITAHTDVEQGPHIRKTINLSETYVRWEVDGGEQIINQVKSIIGKTRLADPGVKESILKEAAGRSYLKRKVVREMFYQVVLPRVAKMTDETLGGICAYCTPNGFHGYHQENRDVRADPPKFINVTGFQCVIHSSDARLMSGRQILIELATTTLLHIACDIIFQDELQAEWLEHRRMIEERDKPQ